MDETKENSQSTLLSYFGNTTREENTKMVAKINNINNRDASTPNTASRQGRKFHSYWLKEFSLLDYDTNSETEKCSVYSASESKKSDTRFLFHLRHKLSDSMESQPYKQNVQKRICV